MKRRARPARLLAFAAWCLAPASAAAQRRCDCATVPCASTAPDVFTVRGRLTEAAGRDANERVERYLAITGDAPVCAEFGGVGVPAQRHPVRASTLQLVITDVALRERLRGFVGRDVTVYGTPLEQMTAHHHTPLMLDVTSMDPPPADGERSLTGPRATALHRAMVRAHAIVSAAGEVTLTDVRCTEHGVGAGDDRALHGPPRPPTYACEGGVTARGAVARGLYRALAAAGLEIDAAMGGRRGVSARRVSCARVRGAVRCAVVPGDR